MIPETSATCTVQVAAAGPHFHGFDRHPLRRGLPRVGLLHGARRIPAPTGTYVYVLVYHDNRDGSVGQVSGEVNLVR